MSMLTRARAPQAWRAWGIALVAAVVACVAAADTPAVSVVYSFGAVSTDGAFPYAGLIQGADGNFYGTTYNGGGLNGGAVFRITAAGALTVVHSFGSAVGEGLHPRAPLLQANDGNFYGTTLAGGTSGSGSVFRLAVDGTYTTLYAFGSNSGDGTSPAAALVQGANGFLYGTTQAGGSAGGGTVFRLPTTGGTPQVLYNFGSNAGDGTAPSAALVQASDGNFYGVTEQGGTNGVGTAFAITPTGTLTTLHSFATTDGATPRSALVQGSDGNLYATTEFGGANSTGAVYRMDTSGNVTLLHSFAVDGSDGAFPRGGVIFSSDGTTLYGATQAGGANNLGTVYSLAAAGGVASVLHSFSSAATDGINPQVAPLLGSDGNLYGTALNGGPNATGAVYSLTTAGTFSLLHGFGGGASADGGNPTSALLAAPNGTLYGVAQSGGPDAAGSVFSISGSQLQLLHAFGSTTGDGSDPGGGLVAGTDGNLYGVTVNGGGFGYGTVYRVTPAGATTLLHSFANTTTEGANPTGRLVVGPDGNFYGVTINGGANAAGTVYRVTPTGNVTLLYSFGTVAADGANPLAGLCLAPDGTFYGTTSAGGTNGQGSVFRVTVGGALTPLFSFSTSGGANPQAALVLDTDGNFYGTTRAGGANGLGAIFRLTPGGTVNTLYSFGAQSGDGQNPQAELVAASDGTLYGTTSGGGSSARGTLFSVTPAGQFLTRYSFGASATDAAVPEAGLTASGGQLFGTSSAGGAHGTGTVFRFAVSGSGAGGGGSAFLLPLWLLALARAVRMASRAR